MRVGQKQQFQEPYRKQQEVQQKSEWQWQTANTTTEGHEI